VPMTVIISIDIDRLSYHDRIESNQQETERSKSHNITNSKSDLLCESFYWCGSSLDAELQIGSCSVCHTTLTTLILDEELQRKRYYDLQHTES
ncbi:MAG: hypothetical protein WBX81_14040, partial [Nitrososphaeraceae archaeon]